jgi:hypothetical protein
MVVDRMPLGLGSVLIEFQQVPRFMVRRSDNLTASFDQSGEGDSPQTASTQAQVELKSAATVEIQFQTTPDQLVDSFPRHLDQRPRLEAVNDTGLIFSRDEDAGVQYDDLRALELGCWRVLVPWAEIITITRRVAS